MDASEVVYEEDRVQTLQATTVIQPVNSSGEEQVAFTVSYEYHLRPRWDVVECHCLCGYHASTHTGTIFASQYEDLPGLRNVQVEKRAFKMTRKVAELLRREYLGEDWSTYDSLLLCYAALGIEYMDDTVQLESPAPSAIRKRGWLEHYTREVCRCTTEDDDGYETEDYTERCALAVQYAHWSDVSGDSGEWQFAHEGTYDMRRDLCR